MKRCDLKLYRGYANKNELVVFGHVVEKYPSGDHKYTRTGFRYARTILQLFSLKTIPHLRVVLRIGDLVFETRAEDDGYFRFQVPFHEPMQPGWHHYEVTVDDETGRKKYLVTQQEEFFLPYTSSFGIISDIDDTFLVSHSRRSLKKLIVLLSKNVKARKPFVDVVRHYQLLSYAGCVAPERNANIFFYVSSSEWNLYDMIVRFASLNGLPKAVLKLKKIKSGLDDFILTGGGSHDHKLKKIHNIISFYPELQFILLGDDAQQDPVIYEEVCRMFPGSVKAVYLRQTRTRIKSSAVECLSRMKDMGVEICYFSHSNKAIAHSIDTGIVVIPPGEELPTVVKTINSNS